MPMRNNKQNQQNPPLPKRKRVDAQGNDRRRLIVKDHGSSMIVAEGATEACYNHAWSLFKSAIENGGGKVVVLSKSIQ